MEAKFCVFCGSETENAQRAVEFKELFEEYKQMAALACLTLDMLATDYTHDEHLAECVIAENEKIIKLQTDKDLREETYSNMRMLFSLSAGEVS